MDTQTINGIEYINADYIMKNASIFCKGARSSRDLMKKKKMIKDTDFIFMRMKDNKYIVSSGVSIRLDKVFVKKTLVETIPELNNKKGITDDGIMEAPEIIELKDSEKFFDNKGNVLEIETRGERDVNNIYFKVKDVEKAFGIKRLNDTINEKTTNYSNDIDYKYFICEDSKKHLFITYKGILKLIFSNRGTYLEKENNIINIITKNINLNWIKNKQTKNTTYRPDLRTNFDNKILIIEIDEYQHKYYDKDLENERTTLLKKDLKNLIILRINPDNYIDKNGNSIIGIDKCNKEFSYRIEIILKTINKLINNKINIPKNKEIKLFFDNYEKPIINVTKNYKYNVNKPHKINGIRKAFIKRTFPFKNKSNNDSDISTEVIKSNNSSLSAIYLLTLGYVKDLKEEMNLEDYDDEMIVCKYGRSDDLSRRLLEHKKTFKSIKSATPMLKIYSYIDSNYASKAEKQIKNYFKGANKCIKYEDYDELVVIDKKFMKHTTEQYRLISTNYVGTQHDMIMNINEIEFKHKMEIKDMEFKLLEKQNELNESIKDNEILKLKLQIAEMKNN